MEQQGADIHFTVRRDSGLTVSFKQSDYCDNDGRLYLAQAYATTVYSSQGSTVRGDVFVYYTSGMDRSAAYVAGSRHKDRCHWFVNREEMDSISGARDRGVATNDTQRLTALAKCMSANRKKFLAIEYLEQAETTAARIREGSNRLEMELEV